MDIKYYLPLYLGCEVLLNHKANYIDMANETMPGLAGYVEVRFEETEVKELDAFILFSYKPEYIKLKLRNINSITENESMQADLIEWQMEKEGKSEIEIHAAQTNFYRSCQIDVDGLINSNLALEKT